MAEELAFKDPHRGEELSLKVVPTEELEVIGHQRKTRPSHVKHLTSSMERIGFIVPVVAVEEERDGQTRYVVIDGQHRLKAARSLEIAELPVIVVPAELAHRMMNLNVEKDLNIRERAFVALGIYRSLMDADADRTENDTEIADSLERAYDVTLGIAYEKDGKLAGSAFEPLLKKCDFFLDKAMWDAYSDREKRAGAVLEASTLVRGVIDQAKELGVWHQYFQYQLLSHVDPYKRKRGPLDFDDVFGKAIAKLENLNENPDDIYKVAGG